MSYESTAGTTAVVFTPDVGEAVTFCYFTIDMPDFVLGDKISTVTNCDVLSGATVGPKSFTPASLYEIVDMKLNCPMDWEDVEELRDLLGQNGDIVITSSYTSATYTFEDCWVKSVETNDWSVEDQGTFDVTFEFGGTVPVLT